MGYRSFDAIDMIGIFVGTVLFGLYTGLWLLAMIYIRRRRIGSRVVPVLLISIWILTATSTALRINSLCSAFGNGNEHQQRSKRNTETAIMATLQYLIILLSDSLICWRLYVVWNRRKAILVVPILLLLGLTVSGFMFTTSFIRADEGSAGSQDWLTASSVFTLAVNIVVTPSICWKIWHIGNKIPAEMERSTAQYHAIMHALIESGGTYSMALILYTAFRFSKLQSAAAFVSYVSQQVVGIAPTLIVIRLHLLPSQHTAHHLVADIP